MILGDIVEQRAKLLPSRARNAITHRQVRAGICELADVVDEVAFDRGVHLCGTFDHVFPAKGFRRVLEGLDVTTLR